jgi:hypothetical protein
MARDILFRARIPNQAGKFCKQLIDDQEAPFIRRI